MEETADAAGILGETTAAASRWIIVGMSRKGLPSFMFVSAPRFGV